MTKQEDKIKEKETETEYTINRCGWDKAKMELRRQKIKQIYKAANPYTNEKTVDEYANAISNSELTLREIGQIHTELANEKVIGSPNLGVLDTKDKGKDKERIEAVQALFTDIHYKDDKNDKHRDYIINSFVESDLELDQIKDLTQPLRDSVKIDIKEAMRAFPGVS